MTLNDYQLAMREMKKNIRLQKISYTDFAAKIGMSISGLKKVLAAKDGSFERISQMAQVLGLSVVQLLESAREAIVPVDFSAEQIAAFARDRELFPFFWSLVYERMSVDQIAAERKYPKSKIAEMLRILERLGVVQVLANQTLRIPDIRPVAWIGESAFVTELYSKWANDMAETAVRKRGRSEAQLILRYMQMTQKTYQEFLAAQRNLESEFLKRTVSEMRKSTAPLTHVRWLACTDQERFFRPRAASEKT